MQRLSLQPSARLLRALVPLLILGGCLAAPPQAAILSEVGTVRAASAQEANELAGALADLRPRLLAVLPDARLADDVEVWLQDTPTLYAFPVPAAGDADGLWSERHGRILLARHGDDPVRTLAHELTHAALGPTWRALPGSLEEGLCDVIAGHLVPQSAPRLRAGRLASAALASGGLRLCFELWPRGFEAIAGSEQLEAERRPVERTRVVLTGRDQSPVDPMEVFRVAAGLSSTNLESGTKRGFYGLAYLVVASVVERHGIEGLHRLCTDALARDLRSIPTSWLLEAAGLEEDPLAWRSKAAAGLGRLETAELLEMYPAVTQSGLDELLERVRQRGEDTGEYEVWVLVEGSKRAVRISPKVGSRWGIPLPAGAQR